MTDDILIKYIKTIYSSPDLVNSKYLAFQLVIVDQNDSNSESTIECGHYQGTRDYLITNMVCNPYSAVIGIEGMTAANGAVTELTVKSVPVNGGVSATQRNTWSTLAEWHELLLSKEVTDIEDFNDSSIGTPNWTTLTINEGSVPVIDSIETFSGTTGQGCRKVTITYKNTTPSSIEYEFVTDGALGITG